MKHCREYNINKVDSVFFIIRSECQIEAIIRPFIKHLLKVNAAECHQDGLLWVNQDILKRHLSDFKGPNSFFRGHWRPLCRIAALWCAQFSRCADYQSCLSLIPIHLNSFHHTTVLYKEGKVSRHSERTCLYMLFVVRLKGVRMSLTKVHGGKALVSSCSVHIGTWIHKIHGGIGVE